MEGISKEKLDLCVQDYIFSPKVAFENVSHKWTMKVNDKISETIEGEGFRLMANKVGWAYMGSPDANTWRDKGVLWKEHKH